MFGAVPRRGTGRHRLTLAGHVQRTWIPRKARQLRPVTLDGYLRQLRLYILPDLGHIPLRSLRVEQIEGVYEHLMLEGRADGTGGLSTKSVLEVHVLLRQILDDAVGRGLLTTNPARQARDPSTTPTRPAPPSHGLDSPRTAHVPDHHRQACPPPNVPARRLHRSSARHAPFRWRMGVGKCPGSAFAAVTLSGQPGPRTNAGSRIWATNSIWSSSSSSQDSSSCSFLRQAAHLA